jgi:hypothetical protein
MTIWHSFFDEGYNDSTTFCIGSIFAPDYACSEMGESILARIAAENTRLELEGYPTISRYHATDCAAFQKEFSKKKGWDHNRQISLTKRICEILIEEGANGVVVGGGYSDLSPYLEKQENAKKFLYSLCFGMLLFIKTSFLRDKFPEDRVKIFYDFSPEFVPTAKAAYADFLTDPATVSLRKHLIGCEPITWRDKAEMQLADFVTFQGFRRIGTSLDGSERVMKSLDALIGKMPIAIERFKGENFADMIRMHDNEKAGRPIEEGVTSSMVTVVG